MNNLPEYSAIAVIVVFLIMDYNRPEGLENLKTRPEGIDLKTR